jgi:hypothetical protein
LASKLSAEILSPSWVCITSHRNEKMYAKRRQQALEEVQVYRDVEVVEELRRAHGDPPKVRFLTLEEQREWERQYPKPVQESGGAT